MKLGEGEEKIGEWHFVGTSYGVVPVRLATHLTNRRLVIVSRDGEESYPLSKITAVKTTFSRSWGVILVGLIVMFFALDFLRSEPLAMTIILAIAGGLGYLGWRGETKLVIGQMGGDKGYAVGGKSPQLMEFMEAVNSKLS